MKTLQTKIKLFFSLLMVLGILLGTVPVHANQTIEFEPIDLPITEINDARIYVHPENDQTVFFTMTGRGIFRSINGGEHWERYTVPGFDTTRVVAMAISESEPSIWYIITLTEMLTTNNSGGTWRKVYGSEDFNGEYFRNIVIHPGNHSQVLTLNGTTLFYTYDAWQSFQSKVFTLSVYAHIGLDVIDNKTIYIANHGDGYSYTNDAGKTWHINNNPWYPNQTRNVAFVLPDPNDSNVLYMGAGVDGKLWKSTNKGTTWQVVYEENYANYAIGLPIFDHQSPQPGLHGAQNTYYSYLAPEGERLQVNSSSPNSPSARLNSIAISHQNYQKSYRVGYDGVFTSDDLGQTWIAKVNGLYGFRARNLQVNNQGDYLFVTGNANLYTVSGDWSTPQKLSWPANNDGWIHRSFYLDPRYPNRQYYYPIVSNNPADNVLYYSDNNWDTNQPITVLRDGLFYPRGMAFDAVEDGPTYIVLQRREAHIGKEHLGIYMSGLPGRDWTLLDLNAGHPYRTLRMVADRTQANTLYVVIGNQEGKQLATLRVNTHTGQYVKIGGEGSIFQTKKVAHITPDPLKPGRIYIGVFPTLDWDQTQSDQIVNYRSDDHGESWTPIRLPGWMFISPQNSDLLIGIHNLRNNGIVYNNDYFKSIDGGQSYQTFRSAYPVYPEESFVRESSHVFDPNDDNVLYFGTNGKGIWKMTFHGQASIYTNSYYPVINTKQ